MKITSVVKLNVDAVCNRVLDRMAFACTKLWNTANYERRQAWEKTGKTPDYYNQCKSLKNNPWARLLHSHSAQAVLQKLDSAYRAWYSLRRRNNAAKPPGFRSKYSLSTITLKKSGFRIEGNVLRISLSSRLKKETGFLGDFLYVSFCAHKSIKGEPLLVEIKKKDGKWYAHIVQEVAPEKPLKKGKIAAIDLGIVNLATVVTEDGKVRIYSGRQILSIQRYFNKQIAKVQARLSRQGKKSSKKLTRLHKKKARQVNHALHAASKSIVEYCKRNGLSTIVIGNLTGLRQNKNFGKNNQKIHSWPYAKFASQLTYKARLVGIRVLRRSERNTSRTCPRCRTKRKSNRKYRGLFVCRKCGFVANADVVGAVNLLKTYPRVRDWIGVVAALAPPLVSRWDRHHFSGERPRTS